MMEDAGAPHEELVPRTQAPTGDPVDALGKLSGAVYDDLERAADLLETIRYRRGATRTRFIASGLASSRCSAFFPDWVYNFLTVPYQVTKGLGYHFFFMWGVCD